MFEVPVTLKAHNQEASRFQVEIEHAPRPRFAANRHPSRRAQTHERDRRLIDHLLDVIAVGGDAVVAVAIKVQAGRVKPASAESLDLPAQRGDRLGQCGVVERKRSDQTRDVNDAFVHRTPLGTPLYGCAQLLEPPRNIALVEERATIDYAS